VNAVDPDPVDPDSYPDPQHWFLYMISGWRYICNVFLKGKTDVHIIRYLKLTRQVL
jgi:hypothetical protein